MYTVKSKYKNPDTMIEKLQTDLTITEQEIEDYVRWLNIATGESVVVWDNEYPVS